MASHASTSPRTPSRSATTRLLPAPSSICTDFPLPLPPLPSSICYQFRQPGMSISMAGDSLYAQYTAADSYFSPSHSKLSMLLFTSSSPSAIPQSPESRRSSSSSSRGGAATKRASISSLLSSPDDSTSSGNDSSAASSPGFYWSGENSPTTTADTTRSNSIVNTAENALPSSSTSGACFIGSVKYELPREPSTTHSTVTTPTYVNRENPKFCSSTSPSSSSRKKPRCSIKNNACTTNRDEYDVLGRKKPKTPRTPMSWDPKDDILLKQLKEEQRLGWKEIATHFRGRTSHACQFRWRRLASGQLKYYQGHRCPPPVTTTSASFASEMASNTAALAISCSPKVLINGLPNTMPANTENPPRRHEAMPIPQMSPSAESLLPPMHHMLFQQSPLDGGSHCSSWAQSANLFQPTPLPTPNSYIPRFLGEEYNHNHHIQHNINNNIRDSWTDQEDSVLLNRKLSFDEVNVLLAGRSEREIWERMVKLRQSEMSQRNSCMSMEDFRRDSFDERIPGIGSAGALGYHHVIR